MTHTIRALLFLSCVVATAPSGATQDQCEPRWVAGFDQITLTGYVEAVVQHGNGIIFGTNFYSSPGATVQRYAPGGAVQTIGSLQTNPFAGDAMVSDLITFDFGAGPEVVVGGSFNQIGTLMTNNVSRWNGTAWIAMGTGLGDEWDGFVETLCVFDDGSGSRLYAAGSFDLPGVGRNIARWNGSAWESISAEDFPNVRSLCVYDDGSGAALYAAGNFTQVGGASTPGIAKWNGSTWSAVGSGTISSYIDHLAVHDDGTGPQLYAGGYFTTIGGTAAANIARWNGTAWSTVGAGLGQIPRELIAHDDGNGFALYAVGSFQSAGGAPASRIARWDGTSWSALGSGLNSDGLCAASWDTGDGPALFVGGSFDTAGGIPSPRLARWRAGNWERLTDGLGFDAAVKALVAHDDGSGRKIFAAGQFLRAGGITANRIARFDGTTWSALGSGLTYGNVGSVEALIEFDDGNGMMLYAGGSFSHAGGVQTKDIARWDGTSWSALPGGGVVGSGIVNDMCVHDDGSGPALYVAGAFTQIGGIQARGVARFDGTTWSALGSGIDPNGTSYPVYAIASCDDGNGRALFVGGLFAGAGNVDGTENLACWRNGAWEALGGPFWGGAQNSVNYLGVQDDGNGPRLWVGGKFISLGGYYCRGVGTWDGTRFWPVGEGFPSGLNSPYTVNDLCSYDSGAAHGARIFATGTMMNVGGTTTRGMAVWDGGAWQAVDGGLGGTGNALAVHDDGSGATLWAGGVFSSAGATPSFYVGRLDPSCPEPIAFCFGDGSGTACPCGNAGASGNGCATSFDAAGAHLSASGAPSISADMLVLSASGLSPAPTTFFQGTQRQNGGAGSLFGDGLRCAGGTIIRLGAMPTTAGASQYPGAGSQPVSVRGQVTTAGVARAYQGWYRNAAAFCTLATFNLTNGVEITWAP